MNKDKISAFTLRISSSNGTGIISILFDIFDEYATEAIDAFNKNDIETGIEGTKKCIEVLSHLKKDLNFNYSVARDLYAIYDYNQRALSRTIYKRNTEGLCEARELMKNLGTAFEEIAENDNSKPIMKNTQKIMAGCTYGKTSLNENLMGDQISRGFLV